MKVLDDLDKICKNFLNEKDKNKLKKNYEEFKCLQIKLKNLYFMNLNNFEDFYKKLNKIQEILNDKSNHLIIKKDQKNKFIQEYRTSELLNFFNKIDHIHTFKYKNKICKCDYHNESLISHSVMVMIVCYIYAEEDIKLLAMITGLLHDIGKDGCKIPSGNYSSFPFHGEYGSLILDNFEILKKYISNEEYESMKRAICVHMCGYHSIDIKDNYTNKRWSMLSIENDLTKKLLRILRVGDSHGKICNIKLNDNKEVMETQEIFYDKIKINNYNFEKYKKILILMCGNSSSGKSYLSKKIVELLNEDKISILSRDEEIMRLTTSDNYGINYKYYIDNNCSNEVNNKINIRVHDSFNNNKITILDTCMNMYYGLEKIVPINRLNNVFIVSIIISRNEKINENDAKRRDLSLEEQIKLHGIRDEFHPLGGSINLKNMRSRYSINSEKENILNPHLILTTNWEFTERNKVILKMINEKIKIEEKNNKKKDLGNKLNLVEHLNKLLKKITINKIIDELKNNYFINMRNIDDNLYFIKYEERCQYWESWARDCRGCVIKLNNKKFEFERYLMPRGAEVLSSIHIKEGINETENLSSIENNVLSEEQKDIMNSLLNNNDEEIYLSFKVDGAIISFTFILDYSSIIYYKEIMKNKDKIHSLMVKLCKNKEYLLIIGTSGNFFINNHMLDYFLTSILLGFLKKEEYDIRKEIEKYDINEIFNKYSKEFINKIDEFYNEIKRSNNLNELKSFCCSFESVCSNRRTLWNKFHKELTINYSKSMFIFLSLSKIYKEGINYEYKPHYEINQSIFEEPYYWKTNINKVSEMLENLEGIVKGKINKNEYINKYKPINKNNLEKEFDYEGFILYNKNNEKWLYSKVKTNIYYRCHKFKIKNINKILDIDDEYKDIFSISKIIKVFYNEMEDRLFKYIKCVSKSFDDLDKYEKYLNGKILASYMKHDYEGKRRIIIHNVKSWIIDTREILINEIYDNKIKIEEDKLNNYHKLLVIKLIINDDIENNIKKELINFKEDKKNIIKNLFDEYINNY